MAKVKVLLEVAGQDIAGGFESFQESADSAFAVHPTMTASMDRVAGMGVELDEPFLSVPMFSDPAPGSRLGLTSPDAFSAFAESSTNPDLPATSVVVAAEVDPARLDDLRAREGVIVWANSALTLFQNDDVFDLARSRAGLDCRPFRQAVSLEVVRTMLGVRRAWEDGFRGQNIAVAIVDEGVNGIQYPVVDGFARPGAQQPGAAPITSHGSMCAADILVAAPSARLYDYPFLGIANSGGALAMFQAILDHRRIDGTPHLTSNSYGFTGVPPIASFPEHEVHDINHPFTRKVREVVASGAVCLFAAGNCGQNCPSGNCQPSGIGPGKSIHAANSLQEVITVAAVNTRHERIGYSSQGPGMFHPEKPDLAAYSHFFGNFGLGRPGGETDSPFDNGTSAATPVAAGVAAMLLSASPSMTPDQLRAAMLAGLHNVSGTDWDPGYGRGIVNAAASYSALKR
ncbi:S8 family serine peptidase [Kribbella sp. NPDC049227]|uniref:S8 family peptidase n=1 Tax=Kribbella sp. NPDC049227 TaxID=3364113 RepID=UPI00371189E4